MKILILLIRWWGGVGRYVLSIKKELEAKGHEVKVISREDDLNEFSFFMGIIKLFKTVKREKYDILFAQDWSMALPFIFESNLFCVFHGHNPGFFGKIIQRFIANLLGKKLIVVGDTLKKEFPMATLNYEGVDMKQFYPLNKKRKYIGVLGHRIGNFALELGNFGNRLKIAKNIPHNKMNNFYNSLEIFINLPPKCTGFNLAWFEAMAAGVPYIIGNCYGIGSKLPIDKIEENEDLFKVLVNSKNRNYRGWLEEHKEFRWENHVNKLLDLFISCGAVE